MIKNFLKTSSKDLADAKGMDKSNPIMAQSANIKDLGMATTHMKLLLI